LLLWCDRDLRAYALLGPLALGCVLEWLRAVDEERPRDWAGFVVLGSLAMWTHYNAIPLVGTLLLVALLEDRSKWKRPVIAGACVFLLYAPWLRGFWTHFTEIDLASHRAHVQLAVSPVPLTAPLFVLFGIVLGHSVFPWNALVVVPVALAAVG